MAWLLQDTKAPARSTALRATTVFRPYRWKLSLVMVCVIVGAILDLVPALVIGELVNEPLSDGFDRQRTIILGLVVVAMYFGSALLQITVTVFNAQIAQGIMYDLRERLHSHIQRMSLRFFSGTRTGEVLSRVSNDVNSIEGAVTNAMADLVSGLVMMAIALGLMFSIDWRLSSVAVVVLLVWAYPIMLVGTHIRRLQRTWAQKSAKIMSHLEETLSVSGSQLVRSFGRQDFEAERFAETNGELRSLAVRRRVSSGVFSSSTRLFGAVAIGFVYWAGSQWIAADELSVGEVVAFAMLTQRVFGPMAIVTAANTTIMASLAIFERVFEYLDLPVDIEEKADATTIRNTPGRVEFSEVTFRYDGASNTATRDVSFVAEPGQLVALVGPSGSGKTTVTYLLQRFCDPDSGRVLLDGHDLRDLTLESVSETIGTVLQDTTLFNTSLADNIRYGRLDATDEEIEGAADIAALQDLVASLPEGLNTVVGERGYRLSGGEKQRVAIARAVLKDPKVLVMDEATSSLDSATERSIREATLRLSEGRTTFLIAHRLSTVVTADQILVMSEGRIAERGTHDQLLELDGIYASLFHEQYGATELERAGA